MPYARRDPDPSPPPADAWALLQAVPVPLLQVDDGVHVAWANEPAQRVLGARVGQAVAELWLAPAAADPPDATARQAAADGHWYAVSQTALAGGGTLWTLQSVQAQRQAQAELAHQHELMRLARDFGRLGFWERDVRTLKGRWDREVLRFWGLDADQATPDFADATRNILPEDRKALSRVFTESLRHPGHHTARYRVRGHDGRIRRIHSQWLVKNGADGKPERVLGLMMDDTEPYALAQAAQELSSQLALTVELSGIAIWRHDLAQERMHYSDQGWAALGMQPRPEGLTLDEVRALIHPDDLPAVKASAEEAMRSRHPIDLEARYRHADGSWRHQMLRRMVLRDDQGQPIAFLGVAMDITDQRQSKQALLTAEAQISLAVRGVGLGTWELDIESGESRWDEQMWLLRGHAPQPRAMTAEERMQCVHPDDRPGLLNWFPPAMENDGPYEHEFRVVWPDGRVRWLASRSAMAKDAAGRRRLIGVNWDVTDLRAAQTTRREHEVALRESQAKSQFMARMSHELRTPLNAMLGFAALLRAEEGGSDPASASRLRYVAHIESAGRHLLSLINDVLDLSALSGGEVSVALQPVWLQDALDSALELLSPLLEQHRVPVRAVPLDLAVMGDATRLRQVLLNLLSNAIKYNRPGGEVRIDARREGDRVRLRVADEGRGLDAGQRRHLFQPFNRLGVERDGIEGTGIGLAIVKTLVERMGGHISVHSQPGVGSVFEIDLAAAHGVDAQSVPARAGLGSASTPASTPASNGPVNVPAVLAQQPAHAGRRQLLYIEDNPVNALIIAELLARRPDLQLHVAVDGASGVKLAQELRPDLVLLDMQLPDFDGYEVLRRLRADPATAGIPCIALSANVMAQDIERALQAGLSDYWTKPLDFRAFMESIEALFGKPP